MEGVALLTLTLLCLQNSEGALRTCSPARSLCHTVSQGLLLGHAGYLPHTAPAAAPPAYSRAAQQGTAPEHLSFTSREQGMCRGLRGVQRAQGCAKGSEMCRGFRGVQRTQGWQGRGRDEHNPRGNWVSPFCRAPRAGGRSLLSSERGEGRMRRERRRCLLCLSAGQ